MFRKNSIFIEDKSELLYIHCFNCDCLQELPSKKILAKNYSKNKKRFSEKTIYSGLCSKCFTETDYYNAILKDENIFDEY